MVYWVLLIYIIAALIWWFIALNTQNRQMTSFKTGQLKKDASSYADDFQNLRLAEKRKTAQYIGEGATFLLLILAGAVFIFRAVRQQFKASQQQQNFMMAITHELKTPIAVTRLNLETLQKHTLEESQQQKLLQNTLQETNRLNTLCNNMLLASQIEAGGYRIAMEPVNLTSLVNNCIVECTNRFPQRKFISNIAQGVELNGDNLLLQMGINNLIDNAIKYSPKEMPVSITLVQKGAEVFFSVKDEGKGILDKEKKKIFDKYYRTGNQATREAKGTGLGLYLTKKIAQQHHAVIMLSDNVPAGSNFTIVFNQ